MYICYAMSFVIYAVIAALFYSFNLYSMPELILCLVMLGPTYLYARSNKMWAGMCMTVMTIATILRLPYIVFMRYRSGLPTTPFMSIWSGDRLSNDKPAGIIMMVVLMLYLLVVWLITTKHIKHEVKNSNGADVVKHKEFVLCRNMMYSCVASYAICVLISVWIYNLKDMWPSMLVFALLSSLFQITHTMYCRSSIREREKELAKSEE